MADEKLFIPHVTECWAPAVCSGGSNTFKLLDPCDVETTDNLLTVTYDAASWKKLMALPSLQGLPPFEHMRTVLSPIADPLEGRDNIAEMQLVSEASVIHAIRARYKKKIIYTDVGRIVIALNPFEARPDLYNENNILRYSQAESPYGLSPHIYQVAAGAYKGVADDSKNQSTLITGESGAGKTESTKLLLRFFAFLGGRAGHSASDHTAGKASVEDRVVMANPILEAFGNASTSRNPNSSRFGKWIEMLFDPTMRIRGASITSYMLEMPRICEHLHCDRNYHVFYHVVANKLGKTQGDIKAYHYLRPSPPPEGVTVRGHGQHGTLLSDVALNVLRALVNDAEMYGELLQAFKDYEFSSSEQTGIFNLVACTLFLGNIIFEAATVKGGEGSSIASKCDDDVATAANLLGVDVSLLRSCLLTRTISTGKESMEVALKPGEAVAARDGLAKLIYGSLFNWLLSRINEGLHPRSSGKYLSIGVLDIAGFERFDLNSFEQLLINLSNEKLQQHFNRDMIVAELEDYKKEGVMDLKLNFNDNSSILTLIEGRGGIMDILDEELFVPKGTDEGFVAKAIKAHSKTPNFLAPKFSGGSTFGVSHFAGDVTYTCTNWLEKNRLAPPREAFQVLNSAHNQVVKQMVKLIPVDTKKMTVGGQFRKQLQELIAKIQATQTHYVRCMKPNATHKPGLIESHELLRQLKCAGIMEAIKIRKSGYAFRVGFSDFVERYAILVGIDKPKDKATCMEILRLAKEKGKHSDDDVFVAQTKVMLRESVRIFLDHLRVEAVADLKRPLTEFIDAYDKALATQDGMFLWPTPVFGKDVDTPSALEKKLRLLEDGLGEVKKKLGTLENPPGWVGSATLARDTMAKEAALVTAANALLCKVKPLCCDKPLVKEIRSCLEKAKVDGIKNGGLDKLKQILTLIVEEEDWEAQLRGKDTDIESLLKEVKKRKDLLTPSCHKAVAEVEARRAAEKKAVQKAQEEQQAVAARKKAEDETRQAQMKKEPAPVADPALLKTGSKTLADDILSQIKPKYPPPKPGEKSSVKAQLAKSISKRAQPSPKIRSRKF